MIKLFITGPIFIQIFMCKINIKNYRVENFLLSSTTLLIEVALYSFRNSYSFILKAGKKYFFFVTIYRWYGQSHRWWNKNHCTYISINLTLIIDEMREKESVWSINPNLISYVLLGDCCVYNFVVVLFGSICSSRFTTKF